MPNPFNSRVALLCLCALALSFGLGMLTMALGHAPPQRLLMQALGGAAAIGACLLPLRFWMAPATIASLLALTLATLLFDDAQGVRRWLLIGPLRLQLASVLLPVLLVALARYRRPTMAARGEALNRQAVAASSPALNRQDADDAASSPALNRQKCLPWPLLAALLAAQACVMLQPDAASASAFALALLALSYPWRGSQALLPLAALVMAALAWLMPNPLPPSDFAEDMVLRAFAISPVLGAASLAALGLLIASPLALCLPPRALPWPIGLAAALYFLASSSAVLVAAYPIPVLGFGPTPLLGAALLSTLLLRLRASSEIDAKTHGREATLSKPRG